MFYFDDEEYLTDKEILENVCFYPRTAFRYIKNNGGANYFWIIFLIFSIITIFHSNLFLFTSTQSSDDEATKQVIYTATGILFGWVPLCIWAALTHWIEKTRKGKSNIESEGDILTLIKVWAHSLIPILLPYWLLEELILITLAIVIFGSMAAIWSLVMLVIGVSEVQNISIVRAMVNITISFVILAATVLFPFYLLVIK